MADGEGGGEAGGSSECLPMDNLVEAMLSTSHALAEALAADRARREAADRIQRESWEAALKEKDAEIDRVRAEAAEAKKKLQLVSLGKEGQCEQEELRDADTEDSRTCAETLPNSKEAESCTNPSQNTVDHTASDFSKLKQAYDTLSFNKDREVSALLLEKDSLRSQLNIMQQDYAELLKNKEVVAAQATESALKLQQSVDELKVLAQKKDDEIGRLQAEAVEAKRKHDKDLCALVSEKDSVHHQLTTMQQDYTKLLKNKKVLTNKKDHEIVVLRAEAVGAKNKVQKMDFLVKEIDDEIQRLKDRHPESVQKHNKDISETHKKSRSSDRAVTVRDKLENSGIRQTVEEDYISETRTVENDRQDERTHKRRRTSSISNIGGDEDGDKQSVSAEDGNEQSRNDEDGDEQSRSGDDDEQIGSDEDGDKQSGSDEVGDEQSGSDVDGGEQSGSGEDGDGDDNDNQSGSDEETTHNRVQKPLRNTKRKRGAYNNEDKGDVMTWLRCWKAPAPLRSRKLEFSNGRHTFRVTGDWGQYVKAVNDSLVDQPDKHKWFISFLRNFESWSAREVAITMKALLAGQPKLICQLNQFLPNNRQIEQLPGCRGQARGKVPGWGHPRRRYLPGRSRDQSRPRETAAEGGGALVIFGHQ
ncbi:eukaryotic translation initiation factor 5B-like [Lolium rigidum]|uniref:eukaryotic translation initiation factor 5B-like n=1 Tax=Lolium rigidum TaxID=89674 RepID=UPI001F5C8E44|nr:eukaryotic translation initiation factor 5B-like [Lolium rigidum]